MTSKRGFLRLFPHLKAVAFPFHRAEWRNVRADEGEEGEDVEGKNEEGKREGSRRVWEKEGNVRFSLDPSASGWESVRRGLRVSDWIMKMLF